MRSEWQTHKGKQFFYCRCADLDIDALRAEIEAVDVISLQQPLGSMRMLTDVRGQPPTREVVGVFIKSAAATKKHMLKSAVIGIEMSGTRKVLFDAVLRITEADFVLFNDIEEAKDWLVSE